MSAMAVMFPSVFPHELGAKPKRLGEKLALDALRAGLGESWSVFYDRGLRGTMRRVDFVAIDLERGAMAIEVKGVGACVARGVSPAHHPVGAVQAHRSIRSTQDGLRARVRCRGS